MTRLNNYNTMKEFILRVSGQANTLTIPKIYVDLTGDIVTALVLNQAIYYSGITKRSDGFFYKSYKEWNEETLLSQYQVSRATNKLKKMKIVETKLKRSNGSPTLHYKIHFDKLQKSIIKKLNNRKSRNLINDNEETQQSLTENYTENYTESSSSSNAHEFFSQNYGMLTPFITENINRWIDDLSEELVLEAMKIALRANKKFNYAEGILKAWLKDNVKTMEDVRAKEAEFEKRGDNNGTHKYGDRNSSSTGKGTSYEEELRKLERARRYYRGEL